MKTATLAVGVASSTSRAGPWLSWTADLAASGVERGVAPEEEGRGDHISSRYTEMDSMLQHHCDPCSQSFPP